MAVTYDCRLGESAKKLFNIKNRGLFHAVLSAW